MLSISLGPVALPVLPSAGAGHALAGRQPGRPRRAAWPRQARCSGSRTSVARRRRKRGLGGRPSWAWLAARLAYVALNGSAYAAAPVSVLDIRDGGWWAPAGWLVGAAWLLRVCLAPARALHRALAQGRVRAGVAGLGLVAWRGLENAARMPPVPLVELDGARPATWRKPPRQARGRQPVGHLVRALSRRDAVLAGGPAARTAVAFVFVNQGEGADRAALYGARRAALAPCAARPGSSPGPGRRFTQGLPTTLFYDAQGRQVARALRHSQRRCAGKPVAEVAQRPLNPSTDDPTTCPASTTNWKCWPSWCRWTTSASSNWVAVPRGCCATCCWPTPAARAWRWRWTNASTPRTWRSRSSA
jgi:hypothetical protein